MSEGVGGFWMGLAGMKTGVIVPQRDWLIARAM